MQVNKHKTILRTPGRVSVRKSQNEFIYTDEEGYEGLLVYKFRKGKLVKKFARFKYNEHLRK